MSIKKSSSILIKLIVIFNIIYGNQNIITNISINIMNTNDNCGYPCIINIKNENKNQNIYTKSNNIILNDIFGLININYWDNITHFAWYNYSESSNDRSNDSSYNVRLIWNNIGYNIGMYYNNIKFICNDIYTCNNINIYSSENSNLYIKCDLFNENICNNVTLYCNGNSVCDIDIEKHYYIDSGYYSSRIFIENNNINNDNIRVDSNVDSVIYINSIPILFSQTKKKRRLMSNTLSMLSILVFSQINYILLCIVQIQQWLLNHHRYHQQNEL